MQNLSLFSKNLSLLRYFSTSIPKPASLNHLFIPTTNPNTNPLNLVVLHGLLGSSSSFHTVLSHPKVSSLANSYLLDLRNHGASEHRDTMSAREMASDVYNFVKENNLNTNLVIMGYSMGARVAMTLCLMHPELLKGAVIVDLAPYDYNIDPRFTYMKKTRVMLEKLVKINMDSEYTVIEEKVKAAARNKAIANFVMTNVRKDDESGKYRWKCNLLGILKNYDEIVGMPEGIEKGGFKGPVKIIFGEDSEFYYENVMPNFKKIFPDMDEKKDVTIIKDAVHQIHVVKPVEFVEEVSNFLKSLL